MENEMNVQNFLSALDSNIATAIEEYFKKRIVSSLMAKKEFADIVRGALGETQALVNPPVVAAPAPALAVAPAPAPAIEEIEVAPESSPVAAPVPVAPPATVVTTTAKIKSKKSASEKPAAAAPVVVAEPVVTAPVVSAPKATKPKKSKSPPVATTTATTPTVTTPAPKAPVVAAVPELLQEKRVYLCASPFDEGEQDDNVARRRECAIYIRQLWRVLKTLRGIDKSNIPPGFSIVIDPSHDLNACAKYNPTSKSQAAYDLVCWIEEQSLKESPLTKALAKWDAAATEQLQAATE
jgi:hypothetical protein